MVGGLGLAFGYTHDREIPHRASSGFGWRRPVLPRPSIANIAIRSDRTTSRRSRPTHPRLCGYAGRSPRSRSRAPKPNPLVSEQKSETNTTVLRVTSIETRDGWVPASGKARVTIEGQLGELHAGDLVEIVGRLAKLQGPANPGERDFRSLMLDQRITATVRVENSAAAVTRLEEGWRTSLIGLLGVIRGWGTRAFRESLPADESGLAAALLLGDTAALDREEWDAYVRTGVVHVLAISGQHLSSSRGSSGFCEVMGVRPVAAWMVAGVMIAYAF